MTATRTLASIAALKVMMEKEKGDFIEAFIPMIGDLIKRKSITTIDTTMICNEFKEEYGITIPYHAMHSILTRCKVRGILIQTDSIQTVSKPETWQKLTPLNIETEVKNIEQICQDFSAYSVSNFGEVYTEAQAAEILFGYLNSFDVELLIASSDGNELPAIKVKNRDKYIVSQFIAYLRINDTASFDLIIRIAMGNVFACMICYKNQDAFIGKLRNVIIYLDTPYILKMTGVEGIQKEEAFVDLVKLMQEHGATVSVFQHTMDETQKILEDCICLVGNKSYDPRFASKAIKYFVDNRYSQDDVRLFISKASSKLKELGIDDDVYIDPSKYAEYQIDEPKLFDIIAKSYHASNYVYENWKKRIVIERDVNSISNIYRVWEGKYPANIQKSKALFLTTNGALVRSAEKYEKDVLKNEPKVYTCYNDVFIGTMLWLQSPSRVEEIKKKSLTAYCLAQLKPTPEIIDKFVTQINRLKGYGKLTDEEYYYLRTNTSVFDYIAKVTCNDESLFYDRLPEEILEGIKSKVREEEEAKTKIVSNQLDIINSEKTSIEKKYVQISSKIELMLDKVAEAISWAVFGLIFIASVLMLVLVNSSNETIKIFNYIINGIFSICSLVFGFNLLDVRKRVKGKVLQRLFNGFLSR